MRLERRVGVVRARLLYSFNSLFEMLGDNRSEALDSIILSFNSLFEMRVVAGAAAVGATRLSILYLRCGFLVGFSRVERIKQLSILYLRCLRGHLLGKYSSGRYFQFSI